jgi:hypothetical protein
MIGHTGEAQILDWLKPRAARLLGSGRARAADDGPAVVASL